MECTVDRGLKGRIDKARVEIVLIGGLICCLFGIVCFIEMFVQFILFFALIDNMCVNSFKHFNVYPHDI
jgi:hypothetical protein